jgi:hypothetical protein
MGEFRTARPCADRSAVEVLRASGPAYDVLSSTGKHDRSKASHRPRSGATAIEKNVFEHVDFAAKKTPPEGFVAPTKKPAEAGFLATRSQCLNPSRCA